MERQKTITKIKEKRLKIGYVQYKVAEMLGISIRHYARIENNERVPTEKELRQLAKIFRCKKADLREGGANNARILKGHERSTRNN